MSKKFKAKKSKNKVKNIEKGKVKVELFPASGDVTADAVDAKLSETTELKKDEWRELDKEVLEQAKERIKRAKEDFDFDLMGGHRKTSIATKGEMKAKSKLIRKALKRLKKGKIFEFTIPMTKNTLTSSVSVIDWLARYAQSISGRLTVLERHEAGDDYAGMSNTMDVYSVSKEHAEAGVAGKYVLLGY